jgi:TM2 domain-containing membrane protein YozV
MPNNPHHLTPAELSVVELRVANENKSTALAYVLLVFFGLLGIHNFYMGRWIVGLIELGLGFCGAFLFGIGFRTIGPIMVVVWVLLIASDFFLIPHWIKKYRDRIRLKYVVEMGNRADHLPSS